MIRLPHDSSVWHLIGEGIEFVDRLAWCPRCGVVRLQSKEDSKIFYYWLKGMDISGPVPEQDPGCDPA